MKFFFINLLIVILSTKFLSAEQLVRQAQSYLLMSGFDVGSLDGINGPKTINALKKAYGKNEINANYTIKKSDIEKLRYLYFKKKLEQWSQEPHLKKKMSFSDARHLLERTGIGANYLEILRFSNFSRAEGIFHILKNLIHLLNINLLILFMKNCLNTGSGGIMMNQVDNHFELLEIMRYIN